MSFKQYSALQTLLFTNASQQPLEIQQESHEVDGGNHHPVAALEKIRANSFSRSKSATIGADLDTTRIETDKLTQTASLKVFQPTPRLDSESRGATTTHSDARPSPSPSPAWKPAPSVPSGGGHGSDEAVGRKAGSGEAQTQEVEVSPQGRFMRVTTADGVFEGDLKDGRKNGLGVLVVNDGTKYEGEFAEDCKNGMGVLSFAGGGTYEGSWRHNSRSGCGVLMYADGSKFEGQWDQDERSGSGVYTNAVGDRYEGEWKHNKQEGHGVYITAIGDRYEGRWKANTLDGSGYMIRAGQGELMRIVKKEGEPGIGSVVPMPPEVAHQLKKLLDILKFQDIVDPGKCDMPAGSEVLLSARKLQRSARDLAAVANEAARKARAVRDHIYRQFATFTFVKLNADEQTKVLGGYHAERDRQYEEQQQTKAARRSPSASRSQSPTKSMDLRNPHMTFHPEISPFALKKQLPPFLDRMQEDIRKRSVAPKYWWDDGNDDKFTNADDTNLVQALRMYGPSNMSRLEQELKGKFTADEILARLKLYAKSLKRHFVKVDLRREDQLQQLERYMDVVGFCRDPKRFLRRYAADLEKRRQPPQYDPRNPHRVLSKASSVMSRPSSSASTIPGGPRQAWDDRSPSETPGADNGAASGPGQAESPNMYLPANLAEIDSTLALYLRQPVYNRLYYMARGPSPAKARANGWVDDPELRECTFHPAISKNALKMASEDHFEPFLDRMEADVEEREQRRKRWNRMGRRKTSQPWFRR